MSEETVKNVIIPRTQLLIRARAAIMDGETAIYAGCFAGVAASTAAAAAYWARYFSSSSALGRIRAAPSCGVSGLGSLLKDGDDKLVVVRGQIQTDPSGSLGLQLPIGAILAKQSQKWAVVVHQIDSTLSGSEGTPEMDSLKVESVPFVLVDVGDWGRKSAKVHVTLDSSTHPLPLTWVYHHKQSMQPPFHSSSGEPIREWYKVGKLTEECILPIGKEVTAIGICRSQAGVLEIKSCMKLPYFLSDKTKDEIEAELTNNSKYYFWSGVVFGTLAIGLVGCVGYYIVRNWQRRKQLRNRNKKQESASDEQPRSNATDLKDIHEG